MPKDSLLDELNDLEGKKASSEPKKEEPKAKAEPKKKAEKPKKAEPKAEKPKEEPKAEEPKLDEPALNVILKMMDGDVDAARKGIADLTTHAVKQFVNGKDLGDKPVSFGDEEPKAEEPKAEEPTSEPKDSE